MAIYLRRSLSRRLPAGLGTSQQSQKRIIPLFGGINSAIPLLRGIYPAPCLQNNPLFRGIYSAPFGRMNSAIQPSPSRIQTASNTMPSKRKLTQAQKITLWVAIIGTIGTIIAAWIAILPDLKKTAQAETPTAEYSGRVLDSLNNKPVPQAKVVLDTLPAPTVRYTDTEGVFLFLVSGEQLPLTLKITVSHPDYEPYTRYIHLTGNNFQLEEIYLTPLKATGQTPGNHAPSSNLPENTGAWLVSIFSNTNLENSPISQKEIPAEPNGEGGYTIRFDPVQEGISAPYSVRWVGTFDLPAGTYEFHCEHRDGCRIYVDSTVWVDAWWDGAGGHDLARELSAGKHRIMVEFYDKSGVGWLEVVFRRK
jgi:hypothetical protein